jgi:hypothetical protein
MRTLRYLPLFLVVGCGDNNASYYRVDVAPEPAGTNCTDGGVRISSGFDDDASGALEGAEIVDTKYVCNGASGGGTVVVKTYEPDGVLMSSQTGGVTLASATLTTEGPGQLIAVASADVFCMGTTDCPLNGNPTAGGWLWASDEDTTEYQDHEVSYFQMKSNVTETISRTTTFDVAAAGQQTIYLRGERDMSILGWFNFYRRGLTLIFLPD